MIVYIPSPLRSYTKNQSSVTMDLYSTLQDLSIGLEEAFPGVRFRMIDEQDQIRPHIKLFVNNDEVKSLAHRLKNEDVVHITCALSGG